MQRSPAQQKLNLRRSRRLHKQPRSVRRSIQRQMTSMKAISSHNFKSQWLLSKICEEVKQRLDRLFEQVGKRPATKGLVSQLRGFSLEVNQCKSNRLFTSLENLLPSCHQVVSSPNQTMEMMSSLISDSILQQTDPQFLIYFTVQLERLLASKDLNLTRLSFKRLMQLLWNICEKYIYDTYESCKPKLGFEAEWLVLEVFDFNLTAKKKDMLDMQFA